MQNKTAVFKFTDFWLSIFTAALFAVYYKQWVKCELELVVVSEQVLVVKFYFQLLGIKVSTVWNLFVWSQNSADALN
jgi:hypothetical protein